MLMKGTIYSFKDSDKYYDSEVVDFPDEPMFKIIEKIKFGEIKVGHKGMTNVFIPDESDNSNYCCPFMIKL